jgi:dTDP-glucose pyrophosphorylase
MGRWANTINKALLPVGEKAAISHIIERFPKNSRFVIAVGNRSDQVRDFMRLAHADIDCSFVDVDNISTSRGGPGYSLLACSEHLKQPFYFVCCDTYWESPIRLTEEQSGYDVLWAARVPEREQAGYCNVVIETKNRVAGLNQIIEIVDKRASAKPSLAFVGLGYIYHWQDFFEGIRQSIHDGGETQFSCGYGPLLKSGTLYAAKLLDWQDLGTIEKYEKVAWDSGIRSMAKEGETFYHIGDRVIKFFADPHMVKNRIERSRLSSGVFPSISGYSQQFFSYQYVAGHSAYEGLEPKVFREMLQGFERNLWQRQLVDVEVFQKACRSFYYEKTVNRLAAYRARLKETSKNQATFIDGEEIPSVETLLKGVPWERLERGTPRFIHGDLQLDNIVVCSLPTTIKEKFVPVDWRQDFAGLLHVGDLTYDFAKLWASIDLNFVKLKEERFEFMVNGNKVNLHIAPLANREGLLNELKDCIRRSGLDPWLVQIVAALVYVNMAGVHTAPLSDFLIAYGRKALHHALLEQGAVTFQLEEI